MVHSAIRRAEFTVHNFVEHRLEVVEEDGVGGALEDQSKTPVGINAAAGCQASGGDSSICQEEGDR